MSTTPNCDAALLNVIRRLVKVDPEAVTPDDVSDLATLSRQYMEAVKIDYAPVAPMYPGKEKG